MKELSRRSMTMKTGLPKNVFGEVIYCGLQYGTTHMSRKIGSWMKIARKNFEEYFANSESNTSPKLSLFLLGTKCA